MELKGSKNEANLYSASAGESPARSKYGYFANRAGEEGFEQIAACFEKMAKSGAKTAKTAGYAATAGRAISAKKRRKFVKPAGIRRPVLKSKRRAIALRTK